MQRRYVRSFCVSSSLLSPSFFSFCALLSLVAILYIGTTGARPAPEVAVVGAGGRRIFESLRARMSVFLRTRAITLSRTSSVFSLVTDTPYLPAPPPPPPAAADPSAAAADPSARQ